ncbi:hypothetical protein ARMGADRAFT_78907 [Armillaria gallica]|uniref:Uncharacterized protein n=1 Tax=Armillaria gallica TaxID=47427 RepID=A0A2H3CEV4_ARMGA|nr:hypothetical protein ARMGADRAFT_78907 [Armillaria gallica]
MLFTINQNLLVKLSGFRDWHEPTTTVDVTIYTKMLPYSDLCPGAVPRRISLLLSVRHAAFGRRQIKFGNLRLFMHGLFRWLEEQTNIATLGFPALTTVTLHCPCYRYPPFRRVLCTKPTLSDSRRSTLHFIGSLYCCQNSQSKIVRHVGSVG